MQLKTIIFDFDGTIADSEGMMIDIINQYSDKYKYRKIQEEEIKAFKGRPLKEVIPLFKIPFYKFPFLIRAVLKTFGNRIGEVRMFGGIDEVIRKLSSEGYRLYVVSSNKKENIENFLKINHIDEFDAVYSSLNIFGKASLLNKLLREEDLLINECIYIGDEVRDINACQAIGLKIISVTWGYNVDSVLKKFSPDFLVDTPEGLYNKLSSL